MEEQSENSMHSFIATPNDAPSALHAGVAAMPIAADRMYQLAALTAGLFLLFTLL